MATGFAVASLLYTVYTTEKQIKDQKEIDELNQANLEAETAESIRRTELSDRRTSGLLRSSEAASGFKSGGSRTIQMESILGEQKRELDWMKTAGASNIDISRAESSARLRLLKAERGLSLLQGSANVYSSAQK